MPIPQLIFNTRDREYQKYNFYLLSQVVKEFLFSKTAYRDLDNTIFNLSGNRNRGFESWSILNYLGLNDSSKGLFFEQDLYMAIDLLKNDPHPRLHKLNESLHQLVVLSFYSG